MASFKSILDDIGNGLKKFFTGADNIAVAAEPFVDVAFPGVSALYCLTVGAVGTAEATAAAAGLQTGTGAQKLALVVTSIESSFNAYWTSIGNTTSAPQTTIEDYVNAVVASLNAIPAVVPAAPTV